MFANRGLVLGRKFSSLENPLQSETILLVAVCVCLLRIILKKTINLLFWRFFFLNNWLVLIYSHFELAGETKFLLKPNELMPPTNGISRNES